MGFTNATEGINTKLIKRSFILYSRDIEIDDFVSLRIDYSELKSLHDKITQLQQDYESVGYRATREGKRDSVDNAYQQYVKLFSESK